MEQSAFPSIFVSAASSPRSEGSAIQSVVFGIERGAAFRAAEVGALGGSGLPSQLATSRATLANNVYIRRDTEGLPYESRRKLNKPGPD